MSKIANRFFESERGGSYRLYLSIARYFANTFFILTKFVDYAISNRYEVKCFFGKFFLNIKKIGSGWAEFCKEKGAAGGEDEMRKSGKFG